MSKRDFTIKQAARVLKEKHPNKTTYANAEAWNFRGGDTVTQKIIYIEDRSPAHIAGKTFREILTKLGYVS